MNRKKFDFILVAAIIALVLVSLIPLINMYSG